MRSYTPTRVRSTLSLSLSLPLSLLWVCASQLKIGHSEGTMPGTIEWAVGFGGAGADSGLGIAVDGQSDVLVTGSLNGPCNIGPFHLLTGTTNQSGVFVAKLHGSNGDVMWLTRGSGGAIDANAIAVDAWGDAYATGSFTSTLHFDVANAMASAATLSSASNTTGFAPGQAMHRS